MKVFSINIDELNVDQATSLILNRVGSTPISIFTPNIDHIVRIVESSHLENVYRDADICLNDSRVLSVLYSLFFNKKLSFCTGSDVTKNLLLSIGNSSVRIGIIGSDEYSVSKLIKEYKLQKSVHHFQPSYGFIENVVEVEKIIDFMKRYQADIWLLALGSPQQEILASLAKKQLEIGVLFCVGASIDYLTGKERRAPTIFQDLYLEWLFRFLQSPVKRFKRYFVNCPRIIYYLLKMRFLKKI